MVSWEEVTLRAILPSKLNNTTFILLWSFLPGTHLTWNDYFYLDECHRFFKVKYKSSSGNQADGSFLLLTPTTCTKSAFNYIA